MLILTREIQFENDLEISSVTSHMEEKFKSFTELRFWFCFCRGYEEADILTDRSRECKV